MSKRKDTHLSTEQINESYRIFDAAWDAARDADSHAGRRYDKRIYAERASEARAAYVAMINMSVAFGLAGVCALLDVRYLLSIALQGTAAYTARRPAAIALLVEAGAPADEEEPHSAAKLYAAACYWARTIRSRATCDDEGPCDTFPCCKCSEHILRSMTSYERLESSGDAF